MICRQCKKDNPIDDMWSEDLCDDCFDANLEQEHADMDIFNDQNGKCALCSTEMSGWICQDIESDMVTGRFALCWPSCEEKLPPPIELTVKDDKILRKD